MSTAEQQFEQKIAEAQQKSTAMVSRPERDEMDLISQMGDRPLRESHNFSGTPMEVWGKIALAASPDVIAGDDAIGMAINLVNYYIHEADLRPDKDGEVKRVIRTVLYDKDGFIYAFTSEGIARDVYRLAKTFGNQPWSQPIPVKVVAIKTGSGYRTFRLIPA